MSFRAIAWVWSVEGLEANQKLILFGLAQHADEQTGLCWPSLKTLSKRTGASIRTVRRKLRDLEELGLIETVERRREDGSQKSSLYRVIDPDLPSPHSTDAGEGVTRQGGRSHRPGGRSQRDGGAVTVTDLESVSRNRSEESTPPQKPPVELPLLALNVPEVREAWESFKAHRREIGKKLTPRSAAMIWKKLEGCDAAVAVEAFETAIAGGWTSIFPEKIRRRNASSSRAHDRTDDASSFAGEEGFS